MTRDDVTFKTLFSSIKFTNRIRNSKWAMTTLLKDLLILTPILNSTLILPIWIHLIWPCNICWLICNARNESIWILKQLSLPVWRDWCIIFLNNLIIIFDFGNLTHFISLWWKISYYLINITSVNTSFFQWSILHRL